MAALVTLEHELAPVDFGGSDERCAWCGRPEGETEPHPDEVAVAAGYVTPVLAAPLSPCCDRHDLPMCDICRDLPRSAGHRDPKEAA